MTTSRSDGGHGPHALARAGYALAGALAALLVGWAVAFAFPWAFAGMLAYVAKPAAMSAALMLWASFKPSRGSAGSVVPESALVMVAVIIGQLAGSMPASGVGITHDLSGWLWGSVGIMLFDGTAIAAPASWALGSSERWARRPWAWVAGELVVAATSAFLLSRGSLLSLLGFGGLPLYGFLLIVASLAFGAAVQRTLCGVVSRVRGGRASVPRHARADVPSQGAPAAARRLPARQARVVALAVSVGASVLALTFFFACRHHALVQGLDLRNIVFEIPSVCIVLTCFVVVPVVAVGAARSPERDYQVAGCAVLCALALMVAQFFTVFRLDAP